MSRESKVLPVCAVLVLVAGWACAQDAGDAKEKPAFGELPPNTGWLSDPDTPAEDIFQALAGGKLHLNDRARFEYAEADGFKPSYAFTNRLRLGYETKPFHGVSGIVEMENVATPDADLYSVPPTGDGDPARTTVADPDGTELNQAWGRFRQEGLFDGEAFIDIKAGRQRMTFDDHRFIGNVGWRQFEQTLDAARVDFGTDAFTLTYAYVWHVQRIFGPDGPNWDADTHLIHATITAIDGVTIAPFVYLLDFDQAAAASSDTFGVRVNGSVPLGENSGYKLAYDATYAHQSDADQNPTDYDADFFAVDLSVAVPEVATFGGGFQYMGSDGGIAAFQFPLGTNHKFNGWADLFLSTPATGLQDLYVYVKGDLPWDMTGKVVYHEFWDEEGGDDLGSEIDAVISKKISNNWSVQAKAAYFDGDMGFPDTVKFWLETTFSF